MTAAHRGIDVAVWRGGTSRGPVLRMDDAPGQGFERDRLAKELIGCAGSLDGLGGGTPTTNKVVLVGGGGTVGLEKYDFEYIVGNVSPTGTEVDWSGTCGNMTCVVVPYALSSGLGEPPDSRRPWRLLNRATGGLVAVKLLDAVVGATGSDVALSVSFIRPGGSVLGTALPTGNARDELHVDGLIVPYSLVDITHPYLFLRWEDLAGAGGDRDAPPAAVLQIAERIRGAVCVQLGLVSDAERAATLSPAVPRVVLLHDGATDADIRITAISMGQGIRSVPVTAALCLAGARMIAGSVVCEASPSQPAVDGQSRTTVQGPAARVETWASSENGVVVEAGVERTARCVIEGRAFV